LSQLRAKQSAAAGAQGAASFPLFSFVSHRRAPFSSSHLVSIRLSLCDHHTNRSNFNFKQIRALGMGGAVAGESSNFNSKFVRPATEVELEPAEPEPLVRDRYRFS